MASLAQADSELAELDTFVLPCPDGQLSKSKRQELNPKARHRAIPVPTIIFPKFLFTITNSPI